ncbi:acetoacetate--CoA ligase [Micromonospora globispora]|uniref:acetoacetate--CoA ligase n=1 Tax=Micromonospora globispora TaxID=1450148 RepID=UPI001403D8CE|nr:acetoacetate--CoA ligase [Micromonospora globispora]
MTLQVGDVLWAPDDARVRSLEFARFCSWLQDAGYTGPDDVASYRDLWKWSVDDVERFWRAFAEYAGIDLGSLTGGAGAPDSMPGAQWFPAASVNYADIALGPDRDGDAIVAIAENGARTVLSWAELRQQVGVLAAFLRRHGITKGDRVAAVLPNRAEAVVGLLAAASLGAIWSVVAPEFGVEAIVARLRQLEPKVLLATAAYDYNGRVVDRSGVLADVVADLPSVKRVVWVGSTAALPGSSVQTHSWADVMADEAAWVTDRVLFSDPLWVLFSSGTTGVPKGIVHGHGGVVLEHLKTLTLHADLQPGQKLLIVGSTSWVVWNMLVSGLLRGATIVLLDGNPAFPDLDRVWQVSADEAVCTLGLGAAYVHACLRAELAPGKSHDLSNLRMVQVTGSPLSPEGYQWVYDSVGEVWLASTSGGTDVAGIFLGGAPGEPVRAGRLQLPALAVSAEAWNEAGEPVVGAAGELVVTKPMPSMPLYFWNDPDGSRYRESYFSTYPGVWRHGDLVEFDHDGSSVILGRSDSTLNRNGVRLGPADLYRVVEALDEVREALVVGVEQGEGYFMPLFVQLADGVTAEAATNTVRNAIRAALSPRYVPDTIIPVSAIPHTRTGKKLEVPVKRLFQGAALEEVVDPGVVDNFGALQEISDLVAPPVRV